PFRLIPPRVLSDYLARICEQEGVTIDPAALPLVVRAGAGSARDSLSVLDQLLGGAGPEGVTYDVATGLLGYTPDNLLDEVVDAFAAQDGAGVFRVVDKVIETGQDPRRFTEDVLRRLRDLVIVAAVPDAPATGLVDVPEDQAERLVAQAARFGKAELVRAADIVAAGLTEMRGATTPRLLLELVCARVLLPAASHDELGFGARLDRLERRAAVTGVAPAPAPAPAAPTRQETTTTQPKPPPENSVAPTPAPPPPSPVAEQAAPAPQPPPPAAEPPPAAAAPAAQGAFGLADVRRIWPDLLEQVKQMRRFTWVLLSQNAQVIGVDDKVLTVGFKNAGARDSFLTGGSEEILRQAAIDMIGADWKVEATVDPGAQPGQETAPQIRKAAVEPDAPVSAPTPVVTPVAEADADVHRDDPPADDGLDGAELLARELGATVIEETTHD
ncbi:MAG: DNA polymerase III subunit gamma/tau, partial [Marmoricola sp.]|nr:DNA polymerase III subunit gamma/tau [Marmoricola sp.]